MLLTVAATLALGLLADWLAGSPVWHRLFYPAQSTPADVQAWSALIYALLLIGGLPVAFLIWHWRDVNVRDQIENARKDINLKEFQEVQLRAAGALDEKLPLEAREQLQIAALHQLRGFLRGDYGDSFKRPAFELLLAGHAAAVERIGVPAVQAQVAGKTNEEIQQAVGALKGKLSRIDRARIAIIRDEADHIFNLKYPLNGRRFDLLDLSENNLIDGLNFEQCSFVGANLFGQNFRTSNLERVVFSGADLRWTHFGRAHLSSTTFVGSNLIDADFQGAILFNAILDFSDLRKTNFKNADLRLSSIKNANALWTNFVNAKLIQVKFDFSDLRESEFEGADLRGVSANPWTYLKDASFDSNTVLGVFEPSIEPGSYTQEEKEAARAPWLARGMVRSDLPPPADEEQPAAPAPD